MLLLSLVGDHILREFNTVYLTRFRTYKIVRPPQTKTWERRGLRQINTCRKVPLQVNFLDDDILHCLLFMLHAYRLSMDANRCVPFKPREEAQEGGAISEQGLGQSTLSHQSEPTQNGLN